jgi:hypothetical protein
MKGYSPDDVKGFLLHTDTLNYVNVNSAKILKEMKKFREIHPGLKSILQLVFKDNVVHPYQIGLTGNGSSVRFTVAKTNQTDTPSDAAWTISEI